MSDQEAEGSWMSENNKKSSMRLMCLISLFVSIGLTVMVAMGWTAEDFDTNLILYFLIGAMGGKSVQKFAEKMK